ncbi:MAG: RND family efflux transporter MFP subunit [Roseivirga sp.]|jgi:RND family efflux transporter MFP subunit
MKIYFSFVLLIFLSLGCKQQKTVVEEPDLETLRKQVKPTEVEIGNAEYRPFEFLINATGTIESIYELKINFESSGYLQKLSIRNGQKVKKGQVIGLLENRNEKFALEKAQVAYEKAHLSYRSDSISRGTDISKDVINTFELNSGLKDARINLREAEINLENTIIKAPTDGIIVDLEFKQGSLVSAGNTLCSIYDPNNLTLTAKVLETDYSFLNSGLLADIFPLSRRDKSFTANVMEINPRVDENGMIEVKLKIKDTEGLLPGMNATAVIRVPQTSNIIVPREALVIKSGKEVMFTFEGGLAKWKYVKIGLDNGVDVEVLEGIANGDKVILTNNIQLAHDAGVSIAEEGLSNSNQ